MADDGSRADPLSDIISLVAGPITAMIRSVDQLRRGAEDLKSGFESFARTMRALDETVTRVNGFLDEVEAPARALVPQLTRTVGIAEDLASRLSGPVGEVVPGLSRLADTLSSPALAALPTDLEAFLGTMDDLVRRLGPLAQIAESAGGLFGLKMPGMPRATGAPTPPPTSSPSPATATVAPDSAPAPAGARAASSKAAARPTRAAKKSPGR